MVPKLLLLVGFCVGLSACVSSVLSTVSQVNEANGKGNPRGTGGVALDNNDEQLFFQTANNYYSPVPLRNPILSQSARPPLNSSGPVVSIENRRISIPHNSIQDKIIRRKVIRPTAIVMGANNKKTIFRLPKATLSAMPGVKSNSELFEISGKPKNASKIHLASIAAVARSSSYGLRVQNKNVKIGCIHSKVIKLVQIVERHYGKRAIVTSGYRSRSFNRRAGGARKSMHISCEAVDIQVEGVSKWNLAKFARRIPGRGGVGTYCRTKSIHIDIGPKRDWHHPCHRKSRRRHF